MKPEIQVTRTERVDDVPLLLAQMEKMKIAELLNKHFPVHGNWQGLGLGDVVVVWLAYILSEGDHRLSAVQGWVAGLWFTLSVCLNLSTLRELDFSDDRLGIILDHLGCDEAWESYETEQNGRLIRVYDLEVNRVRIDSTTVKSYVGVSEMGLFQLGHSKEHRPDLPQLKINQSALDPLGLPLSTTIVSGEKADDPLYIPEIRKVQESLQRPGVLYVGDCKMSAQDTRAYVTLNKDYYLCPLSAVQMPAAKLQGLLDPVWTGVQILTPVYRPVEGEDEIAEQIAKGFIKTVTMRIDYEGTPIEWQERQLIVHSFKYAKAQERALKERLKKAEKEIAVLNLQGRGRKKLNEQEIRSAAEGIITRYRVTEILTLEYSVDTHTKTKRAYRERPAQTITVTTVTVHSSRNTTAYAHRVRNLGWRVFVCNDTDLSLVEAVLAYREEYLVERGFNRLRGEKLGITPLYLSSTTRIKGLIRLLCIALRVLCLIEYVVREALQEQGEKLDGIYKGNPKRATAKPTTEMMLAVFRGISLTVVHFNNIDHYCITPLNAVQIRILTLLGGPLTIYYELALQSDKLAIEMRER